MEASRHDSSTGLEDEEEMIPYNSRGLSLGNIFSSLRHAEQLDPCIQEEVDPDAPSDEEDEHLHQQALARVPLPQPKPGVSPPRPQSVIKMRHQRITRPSSVVHHKEPPVPPSPRAVNPHTISQFHRLKVQVKLAKRQARKRQQAAKLEDRYQDVEGYNKLWKNFSDIQSKVEDRSPPPLKRSDSFDLKDTDTWFFDFQSCEADDVGFYDSDDDASQSSLSLHSTTSMESQRRYFREKRERRLSRQRTEPNLSQMSRSITMFHPERKSSPRRLVEKLLCSSPPKMFHRRNKDETGTPSDLKWEESLTPNDGRGQVAPTLNAFQLATGEPDYHVFRGIGDVSLDKNEDTPKAKSKRSHMTDTGEVDVNNDYQVPRRRRVASCDSVGVSLLADEEAEVLGIQLPPSPVRNLEYSSRVFRTSAGPRSPKKSTKLAPMRDFGHHSSAVDIVKTTLPTTEILRMSPKEDTRDATRLEKVVHGNAARSLEEAATVVVEKRASEKKREVNKGEPFRPSIITMSTEEFYRGFSDDHALVRVSQTYGHDILYEHSPKRPDYDTDTEGAMTPTSGRGTALYHEGTSTICSSTRGSPSPKWLDLDSDVSVSADRVSTQVDDILAAYRNECESDVNDNEWSIGSLTLEPPL